jgi:hypothetical protein
MREERVEHRQTVIPYLKKDVIHYMQSQVIGHRGINENAYKINPHTVKSQGKSSQSLLWRLFRGNRVPLRVISFHALNCALRTSRKESRTVHGAKR